MTRMCVLLAHAVLVRLPFVVVLTSSLSVNTMPMTTTPMVPSRAQDTTTIAATRMTVTRMASTNTDNEDGSSLVSVSSSSSSSSSPPPQQQHPRRQRNNDRRYFIHMLLRKTTVGLGAAATATTGMTSTTGIWKPGIDGASAATAAADTDALGSSTGTSQQQQQQQSQLQSQSQRIPPPPEKRRIIRLSSGLQFSDIRVGSGPKVMAQQQQQSSARNNNDENNSADTTTDTNNVVLMHVKALRQDNAVLFDTRAEGPPILFELGSIADEKYYFNAAASSSVAKGRITLGIQEAILAPGIASWEGGYSNSKQEVTMRSGGIRFVVVPSELAYGQQGVSRYDAFQMKLQYPVPRNELLRYEIELFRCNEDTLNVNTATTTTKQKKDTDSTAATPPTVRACCPEELYPCQLQ